GTSLPELVTTVQSARKGKGQFIIGNILGSNIFNIGVAMSIAGLINPAIIDSNEFLRDILLLFLSTVVFYVITKSTKHTIKVVYSILLITIYCIYILMILK
ncbi:MAG: sodium:calcium antiporter, partial [Gammaproteobacteria bacterium]